MVMPVYVHKYKIIGRIVMFYLVIMMHSFIWFEFSPKFILHNIPVFLNFLSGSGYLNPFVTLFVKMPIAVFMSPSKSSRSIFLIKCRNIISTAARTLD